jgi:hypothetical protein
VRQFWQFGAGRLSLRQLVGDKLIPLRVLILPHRNRLREDHPSQSYLDLILSHSAPRILADLPPSAGVPTFRCAVAPRATQQPPAKMASQEQLEYEARDWIEAITGEAFRSDQFADALKDGVLLCKCVHAERAEPRGIASTLCRSRRTSL